MRQLKPLAAIFAAMFFGTLVATMTPGCKPATPPPARPTVTSGPGDTLSTTDDAWGTTDDALMATDEPLWEIPDLEPIEDAVPVERPAEPTPVERPAEPTPVEPVEPAPVEETPAEDPATSPAAAPPADVEERQQPSATDDAPPAERAEPAAGDAALQNPVIRPGDWNQWGGTSLRNNVPVAQNIPLAWEPGRFDRRTGAWNPDTAQNIKWVASLGSQSYGNPVVASGKVFVGTNNSHGYLKRYPGEIDLGVLVCFDEQTGEFLWQHSSEKLPTGRVHDWPLQGICCSPYVEGDRLWFVTSRGEVRCLDVNGFHDGQDDGRPEVEEPARLFDVRRNDDPAEDKVDDYVAELNAGKIPADLLPLFESAGMPLAGDVSVQVDEEARGPVKRWTFQSTVGGAKRDFIVTLAGPNLSAFKIITPDDKHEADVIWSFDMMKELGISQHNMCSCSVTVLGDILFVNTSNGVDESHIVIPAPDAPSFVAMDKNTAEVYWTDNSPGRNILHGQWSSPAVAIIDGVPQVIFAGGDAWVYSFRADKGQDGKPELLWKFDANPKDSILELGGRGTRNDVISTPVVYDNKVYFATGQDPDHGEGEGILWCIDPTKRGDISEMLAVNRSDPSQPIPVKRIQAVVEEDGDVAIENPNSGVVWKYTESDLDGDGRIDFNEQFHRSMSTVAIKDDLLFVPDFSGLVHCVDAQTGKVHWTHDMLSACWGSPMIVNDKVYVGDEDGDISIFNLSADPKLAMKEVEERDEPRLVPINARESDRGRWDVVNMGSSVYSTPIVANGVLFISNKDQIFAIAEGARPNVTASVSGE
jgi:outer membrane protein assembly factor BamB